MNFLFLFLIRINTSHILLVSLRKLTGSTSPSKAQPGTIRGDYSHISMGYATYRKFGGRNLIHASGTKEEAKKEINLWFKENELYNYKGVHDEHVR